MLLLMCTSPNGEPYLCSIQIMRKNTSKFPKNNSVASCV